MWKSPVALPAEARVKPWQGWNGKPFPISGAQGCFAVDAIRV